MMKLLGIISILLGMSLSAVGQYRNPIIPGFHPDPSICRVGDDFYVVNSSFQYFPGVPVYHSKDLVNWELTGNVLDRESQLPLKGANSWLGIYAPTIRYHNGTYYMITTNVGNGGNFMVTAKSVRGPWSEPKWLKQGGIDPSLYFENGRCYMVSNPDNTIMLCQIDPSTGRQLSPSKALWQGTGGRYPEGPHIYKKDGYYYLLISEGGTEMAHSLTIARSRKIDGPYEANPNNPLLTHCSMAGQSNPIQGTGHGDFVQAADGSWWIVFLGYRNFEGSYHHIGRETYLAPVEWKEGEWPVVNGGQPVDTLMTAEATPQFCKTQPKAERHIRTTFDKPLGPEWVYIQNPDMSCYELFRGKLRLTAGLSSLTDNQRPTFVGRRQESPVFSAETRVDFEESLTGDEAGLTVYQINDGHAEICLEGGREKTQVCFKATLKDLSGTFAKADIDGYDAWLRVRSDGNQYFFEYSPDGKKYRTLFKISCTLLSTETVGGFTGVVAGMYCTKKVEEDLTYANFDKFRFVIENYYVKLK